MSRLVTLALAETKNAFADMPERLDELPRLAGKMEAIRAANVAHHVELTRAAADRGAQVIGFGELFPGPYFAGTKDPMWLELAEDAETGPTVTELRALAESTRMIIVAPIYELDGRTGRRFNTAVVIDERGDVLGRYRKTHIPHGKNEQGEFSERFYYGAADDSLPEHFPVFETRIGRLGVAICYDRHFEGVMRTLKQNGAELVFSPAVTFGQKSEHLWELEFEVDAARNHLFIAGSNRLGAEPPWNVHYFGKSHVVGPNGRIPADRSVPGLVLSTIDLDELSRPDPSGWTLERDRRPDIYGR